VTMAVVGAIAGPASGSAHWIPARLAGWLLAAVAAALLTGAAAVALVVQRQAPVLILDLAVQAPSAPAIAAVAEAAPEVAANPPSVPTPAVTTEDRPVLPDNAAIPDYGTPPPVTMPLTEAPVLAETSVPPKADTSPRPKARPTPKPSEDASPRKTQEKPKAAEPHPIEKPASAASAPSVGAKPKGGALSPAAYARAVLKKVRATQRASGVGRGRVVVGFTIAADGRLAGAQVLESSGDAGLDAVALDHIRRSAPFPVPPPGSLRQGYSFEFVGR
jgi:periplasmic protein TonB